MLQRQPGIRAGGEDLQPGSDPGIGVGQRGEGPSVQGTGNLTGGGAGEVAVHEHRLPGALGVDGAAVEQRAHAGLLAGRGEHVEVLLRAIGLPRKAEELEQKRAPLGVGRIAPDLGAQRLDGFVQPSGLEQRAGVQPTSRWPGPRPTCR